MSVFRRWSFLLLLIASLGSISSKVTLRCTITSPPEYRDTVARCINASQFWQAYFDELASTSPGQPLVDFKLDMERKVNQRSSSGGDYDPGTVTIRLAVTNLRNRRRVYEREAKVGLDDIIFGLFDADATREEIQQKAFEATEKRPTRISRSG